MSITVFNSIPATPPEHVFALALQMLGKPHQMVPGGLRIDHLIKNFERESDIGIGARKTPTIRSPETSHTTTRTALLTQSTTAPDILCGILNGYRRAYGQHMFSMHALYYPELNLSYTYIPKNGCSTLRSTFGLANGDLDLESPDAKPLWIQSEKYRTRSQYPHHKATRVIVIRDPFKRMVSAYLDKIATLKAHENFAWQACVDILINHRGVPRERAIAVLKAGQTPSFAEFIAYLHAKYDAALNGHFKSQCCYFAFEAYHELFALETLNANWESSSLSHIQMNKREHHSVRKKILGRAETDAFPHPGGSTLAKTSGGEIFNIYSATHKIPSFDLFYSDPVIQRDFFVRFADDIVLFQTMFPELATHPLYREFDEFYAR